MRDDRSRLQDIVQAIERIQRETSSSAEDFAADEKLQVWVLYHLQVIGEACRTLSTEFRNECPDPVWSKAVGLRNILVHHYFEIDAEMIRDVVVRDLPPLLDTVLGALRRFEISD